MLGKDALFIVDIFSCNMVEYYLYPHSVVTHIGSVTRDQKVPGSPPIWVAAVWTYTSGA